MDEKFPCEQAKRCLLGIESDAGGCKCHFLPRSQTCGGVHNGGTVGEWLVGVGGRLEVILRFTALFSATRCLPSCLYETALPTHVYLNSLPYMLDIS